MGLYASVIQAQERKCIDVSTASSVPFAKLRVPRTPLNMTMGYRLFFRGPEEGRSSTHGAIGAGEGGALLHVLCRPWTGLVSTFTYTQR